MNTLSAVCWRSSLMTAMGSTKRVNTGTGPGRLCARKRVSKSSITVIATISLSILMVYFLALGEPLRSPLESRSVMSAASAVTITETIVTPPVKAVMKPTSRVDTKAIDRKSNVRIQYKRISYAVFCLKKKNL